MYKKKNHHTKIIIYFILFYVLSLLGLLHITVSQLICETLIQQTF